MTSSSENQEVRPGAPRSSSGGLPAAEKKEPALRMRALPVPLFCLLALLAAWTGNALACRYNVRETGFVDLGLERYRFYCYVAGDVESDEISRFESIAKEAFEEVPISWELVPVDQEAPHPALEFRPLQEDSPRVSAALVSDAGHSLWLGSLDRAEGSPEFLRQKLQELTSSPLRTRIAEELATAMGVVLFIEGEDDAANARARNIVDLAIESVEAELEFFPKPIEKGPTLIPLRRRDRGEEGTLLWSLHLEPGEIEEPMVVVLYGRGRWIGPAMAGSGINLGLLSRVLFLIGLDCECGLDPSMLRGTLLPFRWGSEVHAAVTRKLGFDPENPLVKMEISQILRIHGDPSSGEFSSRDRVTELNVPSATGARSDIFYESRTFSRILYLLGGFAGLALLVGSIVLLRSRRESQ